MPRALIHPSLILSLLVASCLAWPAMAGVYYKAETLTEPDRGQSQRIEVEAWVDGERAKIVFSESNNPLTPEGSYLLTSDGGKTLLLVDPKEKTYSRWDLDALMSSLGGMLDALGGVMSFEFSEPRIEKLLEEPGGELLGLPTTHTRYRTTYSMQMKIMGMKRAQETVTEQDLWTTTAIDEPAFGVWLRNDPPRTGDEDLDRLIAAEVGKVEGFPLKTVAVSTSTGEKKKSSSSTRTTTEVTMLERRDVPAATFELPAGYEERAMTVEGGEGEEEANPLKGLFGNRG